MKNHRLLVCLMHNIEYPDDSDFKVPLQQSDSNEQSDIQRDLLSLRRAVALCQATDRNDAPQKTYRIEFSARSFK